MFFNKKTILYKIKDNSGTTNVYSTSKDTRSYPIAIIINSGTASASEILASCFKERYKDATIVGTTTYGKGTVQKVVDLTSGSHVKYTTQNWLTPKGKWIEGDGITPTHKVANSEEYYNNPSYDNDDQLKKAIELVSK